MPQSRETIRGRGNQNHSGRSRYSPPRSSRLAWRQGPQGSEQHLALAAPATRARAQRPRKYLAVHATELAVEPNFQILRRYRRSLLLRLEHAHRSAVENHVHRPPRLGSRRSLNLRIGITRRDLQIVSRDMKRPWEIGKAFDASAPCGPLQPASKIGHPNKGRIALKANGKLRQDGDLAQMIWNVPEVIVKLSEMVALAAGDVIMTGTPSGVAATVPGDKLECEIEGVGSLTVTIGPPAK